MAKEVSFTNLFESLDRKLQEDEAKAGLSAQQGSAGTAIERHMHSYAVTENMNGFKRMQMCRQALEALDRSSYSFFFWLLLLHNNNTALEQERLESLFSSKAFS